MTTISTEDLATMLKGRHPATLIMAMGEAAFAKGHIPGSKHADHPREVARLADLDTEVVVYCTGSGCAASGIAYRQMIAAGYRNVRHYAGGLAEWNAHGFPVETGSQDWDRP